MASPLRNPLSGLVWAAMAVIYLPLLPASGMLLAPAFSLSNWAALFADPQLPQALAATLVSTHRDAGFTVYRPEPACASLAG